MKNKLGLIMVVAMLAMAFSCGSKSTSQESAAKTDSTTTVKADSTAKTQQDTVKAK
jgi:hypothetical protein